MGNRVIIKVICDLLRTFQVTGRKSTTEQRMWAFFMQLKQQLKCVQPGIFFHQSKFNSTCRNKVRSGVHGI